MSITSVCCCSNDSDCESIKNEDKCPACGLIGVSINKITVEHLVTDDNNIDGSNYKICMNENCDVVYYCKETNTKFLRHQIKVPIWFKKDANPKYACYCSKVTEEQVIDAVLKHGAKTIKDVNRITGSMKKPDCQKNNPMGVCCHKIIQEAINKGLATNRDDSL